ncbi:hypothetical protein KIV56_04380 [Cryobacterium breve]|uniref:DUF2178 domain-containing protein n=1 Tax=Cryobacterium breve TaxID=1259258 RepID=A0ABY7NEF6_9MICO|nr:hypothetical protein [Cryobacterium breve]WBM80649.1 hypothetical protein KIV56_04380 [Cryobacterium breve]
MKDRFIYIAGIVIVAGVAGGLVASSQGNGSPQWMSPLLLGLLVMIVMSAGIGAVVLRKRSERQNSTATKDSLERQAAVEAQSKTFIDMLFLTVTAGCLFIIFPTQTNPAWILIGIVVALIADFWVRSAVIMKAAAKVTS